MWPDSTKSIIFLVKTNLAFFRRLSIDILQLWLQHSGHPVHGLCIAQTKIHFISQTERRTNLQRFEPFWFDVASNMTSLHKSKCFILEYIEWLLTKTFWWFWCQQIDWKVKMMFSFSLVSNSVARLNRDFWCLVKSLF